MVGLPDERWGELVVAYVVPAGAGLWTPPPARPTATATRCWPPSSGPRAYRFVYELPMTATGKKLHYQLREQAARDAAEGLLPAPVSAKGSAATR